MVNQQYWLDMPTSLYLHKDMTAYVPAYVVPTSILNTQENM